MPIASAASYVLYVHSLGMAAGGGSSCSFEVLAACRDNLVIPEDVGYTSDAVFLKS
jgi:hypothetical protein